MANRKFEALPVISDLNLNDEFLVDGQGVHDTRKIKYKNVLKWLPHYEFKPRVMTVVLNFNDSNPATWGSYKDDAVNLEAGSDEWDKFFGEYPCLLKDGVEGVKLNPDNLAEDINGNAVDIVSGESGDVMVKYPKRLGIFIRWIGDSLHVSMTDAKEGTEGFEKYSYNAHYYKGKKCSSFYRGAFKGYSDGTKLHSLSGKGITVSQTISAFRSLARANGGNYEQSGYWQILFRQCMYLLKYRGQNAQEVIGRGYVDGNSSMAATGNTNANGSDFGATIGTSQVKLFNEEDAWGNAYEFVEGLATDASFNYLVNDPAQDVAFNDAGTGYVSGGSSSFSQATNSYISSVVGTNKGGFLMKSASGSETTYLCDAGYVGASCVAVFGGYFAQQNSSQSGLFHMRLYGGSDYTDANTASRLQYFKVIEETA